MPRSALGPAIIGIMRVTLAAVLPFLVQKLEPRRTFAIGQFLKAVSMICIAIFFTFQQVYPQSMYLKIFDWVPFAMILVQFFLRSVTVQPVLYTLLGELFPTDIRTLAVGIVQSSFFASAFIIVKTFPDLKSLIGLHGVCYLYASLGLINTFWSLCTIPDNRGLSLIRVEESYQSQEEEQQSLL